MFQREALNRTSQEKGLPAVGLIHLEAGASPSLPNLFILSYVT